MKLLRATAVLMACALGVASGVAAAQSGGTVVPVLDTSGKVKGFLALQPVATTGAKWRFGGKSLANAFGLGGDQSLALVCDKGTALTMRALGNECLLGSMGGAQTTNFAAAVRQGGSQWAFSTGKGTAGLPEWLGTAAPPLKARQNDLGLYAEHSVGRNGVVTIAGTVATARLIPAAEMPGLADSWNTRSLSVGAGVENLRASVVGRVVNVPGQPSFSGLGVGITWRTPWSGQLSVGAENVVTKGSNPFSTSSTKTGGGDNTVPYVKYQQDL